MLTPGVHVHARHSKHHRSAMSDPQGVLETRRKAMKRGLVSCVLSALTGLGALIATWGTVTLTNQGVVLVATFGTAAVALSYAAAQQRCPHCDRGARGILYRAQCPHCDARITP